MRKAIVDSCFLSAFKEGLNLSSDFFTLIRETDFELCIHPYIMDHELDMYEYVSKLIDDGTFHVIPYDAFILDDKYKEFYRKTFVDIYNEFVDRMESINPNKVINMRKLDPDTDVFEARHSHSSLGDVHMIMLALFEDIPIILSEDNIDLFEAYKIAAEKFKRTGYNLVVYKATDLIDIIESNPEKSISHKELKKMKRAIESRRRNS